jgi:hypothetical protein
MMILLPTYPVHQQFFATLPSSDESLTTADSGSK